MNKQQKRLLRKKLICWLVTCSSLIFFVVLFGDLGILFAVSLGIILAKYA